MNRTKKLTSCGVARRVSVGVVSVLLAGFVSVPAGAVGDSAGLDGVGELSGGSFGVGGSVAGGVDPRSGVLGFRVPVVSLPGLSSGGVDLSLAYSHRVEGDGRGVGGVGVVGVVC